MAENKDYYAILQVSRDATPEEIAAAHERLSRLYDPETSHKPRAAQRHAEVQAAFEALSDRTKRREVDKDLRAGEVAVAGAGRPSDFLANRYVVAGALTLAAGVLAILGIIIVFAGGGGEDELVAAPTDASTPAPTAPAHTPGVAPESPPDIPGDVIVTPTGLGYIDFEEGSGETAVAGDMVAVDYSGWLQETGELFDSSIEGPSAFSLVIDAGTVIPGWDEGLQGMVEGGKRRLIIPPELGYGELGRGQSIPGNSTLIFDIELVDILVPVGAAEVSDPVTPAPNEPPPEVSGEETSLDSGLVYIDFVPGVGQVAETGDTVTVNYTGWLQETGQMFDSGPFQFVVGNEGVIAGWDLGLPGMAVGGSRRLIIPADLAYGEAGTGGIIPPNATLIFDIELVDIPPAP